MFKVRFRRDTVPLVPVVPQVPTVQNGDGSNRFNCSRGFKITDWPDGKDAGQIDV